MPTRRTSRYTVVEFPHPLGGKVRIEAKDHKEAVSLLKMYKKEFGIAAKRA